MAAVRYGPLARAGDWWHGWRDGRAVIPRPGSPSTPHRDVLLRRVQEEFEHERLRHEASWSPELDEVARLTSFRPHLVDRLSRAGEAVVRAAVPLSPEQLTTRRLGEERHGDAVVRLRRTREHARRLAAAEQVAEEAHRDLQALDAELEAARARTDQLMDVAAVRVRRAHQHAHRRIASYVRRLVRSHPDGARVLAGVDVDEPILPEWVRSAPVEPTPKSAFPVPPMDDPAVRAFTLRDRLTIGCSPDNDVVVEGYHVAAEHGLLVRSGDHVELRDLGHGGTFLGGRQVRRATLTGGEVFDIADHRFHLSDDLAVLSVVSLGTCDLAVHELTASSLKDGEVRMRLTGMSFVQRARTVLAILGPSGAGKSSLFAALLGELEPSAGRLYFRGLELGEHREQIRSQLGFVPQDDHSMHWALTVGQVLGYAHRLRRPSDRPDADPVAKVCDELGLKPRLDDVVGRLSGGQRKRVSIALEMLSAPRLLMLDEPTSGLDPGMDRDVMRMLRDTARAGSTVVVVTHATEHLWLADQVLVVASEGRAVYSGPPSGVLDALEVDSYADLMKSLEEPSTVGTRTAAYREGPMAGEARAVVADLASRAPQRPEPAHRRGPVAAFLHQFPPLVARQVALSFPLLRHRDRSTVATTLLPFLIACTSAVIAAVVTGDDGLGAGPSTSGPTALSILVTLCVLTGQALSYSNLVEERAVIAREHRTGMATAAVVLAKWAVFTAVSVVQTALVVGIFLLSKPGPAHAVTGLPPGFELFWDLTATSVAAMSLGLLVSALCRELKQAVTLTSLTIIAQVALNGVTTDLSASPIVNAIAALLPARWGLAAAASTVDLRTMTVNAPADELWRHDTAQWATDLGALGLSSAVFVGLAVIVLDHRLRRGNG
ncbi:ATP-binding cassette domain-containing protein [Saccharothrix longispora]|uniref:ABC-type multidrug transport system ATPase subunit n=1 Tax=Saccharothrix longispora TaxID=33920 RepID=A0ABU1Q6B2_9PSEU|nr:ATP-binding cassette domain-containing protein [Saccharothrix longispora]MDR6598426.1 ABC-type multidrug transport system ATPase subunit [Saccharothrix longispora]